MDIPEIVGSLENCCGCTSFGCQWLLPRFILGIFPQFFGGKNCWKKTAAVAMGGSKKHVSYK